MTDAQPHHPAHGTDATVRAISTHLHGQLRRIRARFASHGTAIVGGAAIAGALLYFTLDRALVLPGAVRVLVTAGLLVQLGLLVRRRLVYPWTREFARDDVAIAFERRFPQLRQRLISAVQLGDRLEKAGADPHALRGQSAQMIERVIDDTASEALRLPASELLDTPRTARVWAGFGAAALVAVIVTLAEPAAVGVFVQRAVGLGVAYPRLTHLVVELLEDTDEFRVERIAEDHILVTLAAGADLPVLVRADGIVPREVGLAIQGGRGLPPTVTMTARDDQRFRYVFRRVQSEFSFRAFGGDDPAGDALVEVATVRPPQVATIRCELTYPAYTGQAPAVVEGGAIEALVGTRVALTVTSTEAAARARLAFVDHEGGIDLEPITIRDDSGDAAAFTGAFAIEQSDRYQILLESPDGLRNPHPGTYPIIALQDHAPVGRMLAPATDDLNVVLPSGIIPVRVEGADDFGLTAVAVTTETTRGGTRTAKGLLDGPVAQPEGVWTALLAVGELGGDSPPAVGDTVVVAAELRDNLAPEAQLTTLPEQRVHVVDPADLSRRVAGHFRRIREAVEAAFDLQESRLQQTRELIEAGTGGDDTRVRLIAIEVGQGRVLAQSKRIHDELMRSFDVHLFNPSADDLGDARTAEIYAAYRTRYLEFHRGHQDRVAHIAQLYDVLAAARRDGEFGALEKSLDPILAMVGTAHGIARTLAPAVVRDLERATAAGTAADLAATLAAVERRQANILAALGTLREQLDAWSDFQDVIQTTRSLRDKQRDVHGRTKTLQGERR